MSTTNDETKEYQKRGKKRGMKPHSQRNKKKRSGVGILNGIDDDASSSHVQIDILPLKFPGDESETNKRIRVVRPYPFTFATYAKARWLGRTVLDVYVAEFGSYPKSYYQSAITEGRILVNGERADCEYKIKGNDELSHTVHRHEPVVAISTSLQQSSSSDENTSHKPYIRVVHEDDNVIVVDKPATLPVHPCGSYNFNSLNHILSDQDPSLEGKLFHVHRLDRLTSGLTIVAKSTETAKILGKCITDRDHCHKVYLARVKGKFPLEAPMKDKLSFEGKDLTKSPCVYGEWSSGDSDDCNTEDQKKNGTAATCFWTTNDNGVIQDSKSLQDVFDTKIDVAKLTDEGKVTDSLWLNLSVPCDVIDHKNGVCEAGSGKPAQTSFAVVGYDVETDSTVVLAKPITG